MELATQFDIGLEPKYFPVRLLTLSQGSYNQTLPAPSLEDYKSLTDSAELSAKKFKYWKTVQGEPFHFVDTLEVVAKRELEIYTLASLHFAKLSLDFQAECLQFFGRPAHFKDNSLEVTDAFNHSSLPGYVMGTFQTYALQDEVLFNLRNEYGEHVAASKPELKVTEYMRMKEEKEWTTSWSNSNGQKKILLPGTRNIVSVPDAYNKRTRTCFFFNGCYWHPHPNCPLEPSTDFTREKRFRSQLDSLMNNCKDEVESCQVLYQCELEAILKGGQPPPNLPTALQNLHIDYNSFIKSPTMRPFEKMVIRDAFTSGLCETYCLNFVEKEDMICHIYDMASQFPHVGIKYPMPRGRYYRLIGDEICQEDVTYERDSCDRYVMLYKNQPVMGIVQCMVFPPTDLLYPFLYTQINDNSIGTLCRQCAADCVQSKTCDHSLQERAFCSTYTSSELAYSQISLGYKFHIFEMIVYEESSYFLRPYLTLLAYEKLRHCRYPPDVKTAQEQAQYCADLNTKMQFNEVIQKTLTPADIKPNEEQRQFFKNCLNQFIGVFGTNVLKNDRVEFLRSYDVLAKYMKDDTVTIMQPRTETVLQVMLENDPKKMKKKNRNTNVTISCFITGTARILIHQKMMEVHALGGLILRVSTDSLFFALDKHKEAPFVISEAFGCYKKVYSKVRGVSQMGTRTLSVLYEDDQGEQKEKYVMSGISLYDSHEISHKDFKEATDKLIKENVVDFGYFKMHQVRVNKGLKKKEVECIRRQQTVFSANLFKRRQILSHTENYQTLPYGFKL